MNLIEKKCPYCAETIKKEAKICRFCGKSVENSENEEIIFQDENVLVTKTRYKSQNTIYTMKDITSVTLTEKISSRGLALALWLLAIIHLIWELDFVSELLTYNRMIDTLIIAAAGFVASMFYKDYYYVTITNNSQQINTLESTDKEYINKIIEAINTAIVKRG